MEPRSTPDGMPVLSRGKHRSSRTGACFMEFASYLAGEPWSDSPQCTDPMLAHLARAVNDQLSDDRRGEIATEIPRVIGLRGDHRVLAPIVALRAAAAALPVVAAGRQQALAVGLLALPRLVEVLPDGLRRAIDEALASAPHAVSWAEKHLRRNPAKERELRKGSCALTVQLATAGLVEACVDDPETLLAQLLRDAIADVEDVLSTPDPVAALSPRRAAAFA
jgi:hypothetical protein